MKKLLYVSLVAASLTGVSFAAETAPVVPAATPAPVAAVTAPAADAATAGWFTSVKSYACGATSKTVDAVKAHPALSTAIVASVGIIIWNTCFAEKDEDATLEDLTSTTDKKGVRVWLKNNWPMIVEVAGVLAAGAAYDYYRANKKAAAKVEAPKAADKVEDKAPATDAKAEVKATDKVEEKAPAATTVATPAPAAEATPAPTATVVA